MKFTLKNEQIQKINSAINLSFPKYTSQLINLANQNAQGTRAKNVGQMSDLFPEYQKQAHDISIDDWEQWYLNKYPNTIKNATDIIYAHVENLRKSIPLIDRKMIEKWVTDLVITKTFNGMYVQQAILVAVADKQNQTYRLATPNEESVGIDGFIADIAYSIKPETYKTMNRLPERIDVKMIFYTKTKTGLTIEVEE